MCINKHWIEPIIPISRSFLEQDTITVARNLLGCILCKVDSQSVKRYCIVETEAYTQNDPACHAFKKTTGRSKVLYLKAGTAYVYLIYGLHYCFNVVTETEGIAGAVLFRALEPLSQEPLSSEILHQSTISNKTNKPTTNGPAKLCKALGITKHNTNEVDLILSTNQLILDQRLYNTQSCDHATAPTPKDPLFTLFLAEGKSVNDADVIQTTRIGISKAKDYLWRFYIKGNLYVSKV